MSVSEKIKAAIILQGQQLSGVAAELGQSKQAFGNKIARGSFSVDDLIRVAGVIGLEVALIDQAGAPLVKFKPEDAAPPRKSGTASRAMDQADKE